MGQRTCKVPVIITGTFTSMQFDVMGPGEISGDDDTKVFEMICFVESVIISNIEWIIWQTWMMFSREDHVATLRIRRLSAK